MDLKIKGTIKQIGNKQIFDSGFQKVEFILTTDDKYPQDIKFESLKDDADNFIKYNHPGDAVEVSFNIRGNEYKEKYYVNLQAWKVVKLEVDKIDESLEKKEQESDDLPF
jgi:single-strand DNA-binding protein